MPRIIEKKIEKYLNDLLPKRDAVLADMERYARQHDVPIIGPACGRLLYLMAQASGARRIFEMGSAIGYSTLWFARAAGPGAEIYYTDGDPANAERARGHFERAGVQDRIRILTGDAVDLIDTTSGEFDIILIDIDKHQYPEALRKAFPRLRHGGLLITDNVLWSGRVTAKAKDAATRAIQQFNKQVYSSPELFPVIVPLRDGVAVCRKA
ncbi:MAG TPA: O-methyltransferase [Candidatus Limnocylindrales bacterium]|nr:O-methyltransferase [Candidatus Limnocylindrales bacterium]